MDQQSLSTPSDAPLEPTSVEPTPAALTPEPPAHRPQPSWLRALRYTFLGDQRIRSGWSILVFIVIFATFGFVIKTAAAKAHLTGRSGGFSPSSAAIGEGLVLVCLLMAAFVVARIERRRTLLEYNLLGPRRVMHFFSGLAVGFLALSALVGAMAWGGWLHFGAPSLTGADIFRFAALWGCAFFLVGCVEEGLFRCYLQATLARGINFWWAIGLIGAMCLDLILRAKGNGVWGVYAAALLGLAPCLWLYLRKSERAGFWQAAWVTSTLFGFVHTSNDGENWIGIFGAAAIGFVLVVSIRVTGSAWWAIGCHAAWDWAETYFYGTIDSGLVSKGHFLTTNPTGNALWSGGTDGPEGSLLIIPIILLILLAVLAIHGRKQPSALPAPAA